MKPKRSEAGWVTLIELLVVTAIIVIAATMLYGPHGSAGGGGVRGTGGLAQTTPGAALEQARGVECQQNLRALRQEIAAYRIDGERAPASLDEIRGAAKSCPVSGNPYAYDPATGTVRCTTPGHESF